MYNIFKRIQHRAVVCTSNLGDGGNETIIRGLVCGHAYSLLLIDEVELVDGEFQRLGKGLQKAPSTILFLEQDAQFLGSI